MDIYAALNRLSRREYYKKCLHESSKCIGNVTRCHSISSARFLKLLQQSGHVYELRHRHSKGIQFVSTGLASASVFTGYCNYHDSHLFKIIDCLPLIKNDCMTKEQVATLNLRAIAREYWAKLNNEVFFKELLKFLSNPVDPGGLIKIRVENLNNLISNKRNLETFLWGTSTAVGELKDTYSSSTQILTSGNFHLSPFVEFRLDGPPILCTSTFFSLSSDFDGNSLVKMEQIRWPFLIIHILPFSDHSKIIVSWSKKHWEKVSVVVEKLNSAYNQDMAAFRRLISGLLITYTENISFNPKFVDIWPDKGKKELIELWRVTSGDSSQITKSLKFDFFSENLN